jgi:rsbT co-antagonist protein RsbR
MTGAENHGILWNGWETMKTMDNLRTLQDTLETAQSSILSDWLENLRKQGAQSAAASTARLSEAELSRQCQVFLATLGVALAAGGRDAKGPQFTGLKEFLAEVSSSRAAQGFSPGETATFVFSLKQPLQAAIRGAHGENPQLVSDATWAVTELIDQLGIFTLDAFQKTREDVIIRQQREIAELSTPVVKLWDRVLALPLIGTLDSERTQVVMENLLQSIVDEEAEIAIIDITGVPTVDTLVAQHLLKTVAAARLMGADCIVSGIRPQIAQTMVHLGVELNVVSKASLADAFAVALARTGKMVVNRKQGATA